MVRPELDWKNQEHDILNWLAIVLAAMLVLVYVAVWWLEGRPLYLQLAGGLFRVAGRLVHGLLATDSVSHNGDDYRRDTTLLGLYRLVARVPRAGRDPLQHRYSLPFRLPLLLRGTG